MGRRFLSQTENLKLHLSTRRIKAKRHEYRNKENVVLVEEKYVSI